MKFFARQKVDAIGITSVSLQKILLFLMILSVFTMFNGGLFSFFLCLVGFLGAYKRHTGMLSAYVIISVLIIVLCFFVALGGMFMMSNVDYEYNYSSSSVEEIIVGSSNSVSSSSVSEALSSSQEPTSPERGGVVHKLQKLFGRSKFYNSDNNQSSMGAESSWSETDSYSFEDDDLTGIIFLSIIVMVIGFFLAYIKIYSLVLAWRLRKMIITERLTPAPAKDSQVHEFTPANTSCAVDMEHPAPVAPFQPAPANMNNMNMNMNMNMNNNMFAPGFAPYPYAMPMMYPPQMQGQYPHHVMFGQQPVFYTYAPGAGEQTEEKM